MDKEFPIPHIFVIDDDLEDFEIFSDFLCEKHSNIKFRHFVDPSEFIKVLEEINLPDLLVLDINMPKLNGFEVFKYVQECRRWENTPIIFLTTSNNPMDNKKAMSLGAVNLYVKPINGNQWKDLMDIIESKVAFP
jgi:CheY-like chemotaxis protein